mgnify:CR=1 FL=1
MYVYLIFVISTLFFITDEDKNRDIQGITQQLSNTILLAGEFTQRRTLQGFSRVIISTGRFIYWKDNGLYWETLQPFFHATTFTPDGSFNWSAPYILETKSSNESVIQKKINNILLSIFSANFESINRSFQASWEIDSETWSTTLEASDLIVKKSIKIIKNLEIESSYRKLHFKSSGSDETEIVFSNIKSEKMPDQAQCRYFHTINSDVCNAYANVSNK